MTDRMPEERLVFARMEIARRRGKGIYLSPRALHVLHTTHIGEMMASCAEEALEPASPSVCLASPPITQKD